MYRNKGGDLGAKIKLFFRESNFQAWTNLVKNLRP
jgi:hypothetical protein